ncbi:MAG: hypothetical protein J6R68_03795 [Clostridia bacterium]|nr:hypothetical protein [Clostridia bacterium]MBO7289354.1 hypothetical protein [Clostridia bacterium]
MKKYFLFTIIIIFCIFNTACSTNTNDNISFEADLSALEDTLHTQDNNEENSVLFRTISGECYHNNGCRYLKSKVPLTYEEAINTGLRPCSICKPEFEED